MVLSLCKELDEVNARYLSSATTVAAFKCALDDNPNDCDNRDLLIATLKKIVFGPKSERQPRNKSKPPASDSESEESNPENKDGEKPESASAGGNTEVAGGDAEKKKGPRRNKDGSERKPAERNIGQLPESLDRIVRLLTPDVSLCPCGKPLKTIKGEVSEMIDGLTSKLFVLQTCRPAKVCECGDFFAQTKAPPRLIEGGMVSDSVVVNIAVQKFAWQSTLYRQAARLRGLGINVDRQTLCRWMAALARGVEALYRLMVETMHQYKRVICDETPVRVLVRGLGRAKTCQFFAHAMDDSPWNGPAPSCVVFFFAKTRGGAEIRSQLAEFYKTGGHVTADGADIYPTLTYVIDEDGTHQESGIELSNCLVHARRNFKRILEANGSPFAKEVVDRFGDIYAIEESVRGTSADIRREMRQQKTKPVMDALKARLEEEQGKNSRKSKMFEAINYMLVRWERLTMFLNDGRLEPDTNLVERAIRYIALNKKNSLFAGSEGGGETWAILSSILITARLNGIDPEAYLSDVVHRIVSGATKINALSELLPWNWKKAQEARRESQPETCKAAA
jgi:transposase